MRVCVRVLLVVQCDCPTSRRHKSRPWVLGQRQGDLEREERTEAPRSSNMLHGQLRVATTKYNVSQAPVEFTRKPCTSNDAIEVHFTNCSVQSSPVVVSAFRAHTQEEPTSTKSLQHGHVSESGSERHTGDEVELSKMLEAVRIPSTRWRKHAVEDMDEERKQDEDPLPSRKSPTPQWVRVHSLSSSKRTIL